MSQNTLNPGMIEEYITQVSEAIERRVNKKRSQEYSRKESRILGALSKLDEFLLNPQGRTCSVAVPGTTRNNSENQELTGDCSLDDPCPEVVFFASHISNLNDSEQDNTHHTRPMKPELSLQILFLILTSITLFCHSALRHPNFSKNASGAPKIPLRSSNSEFPAVISLSDNFNFSIFSDKF